MVKNSACNTGVTGSLGRDPLEEEMAITPLFLPRESHGQKRLMGYIVHEVTKSQTRLSDWTKLN